MLRGFIILCFTFFIAQVQAEELSRRDDLFAKADIQQVNLSEAAVRLNKNNFDRSSIQYLLSASGTRLPVHYIAQTDISKMTFVFIGGFDSDLNTFTEIEEILLPLGYGVVRLELPGQGNLISKNPIIDPITLVSQSRDLISILDQLKIDKNKIALVGYSYGAAVAIQASIETKVASLNLLNPLIAASLDNSSFASIFMRLKNISGPAPTNYQDTGELLAYLSTLGEYANQDAKSFNLSEVTAAYNLFAGVPVETADELSLVSNRVSFFDGLADLVFSSSEKAKLFSRVLPIRRGIYYRADGVTHHAEQSPVDVVKFLTEANP